MSIHLAKGLEFDNVFVAGCAEGLMPHQMSYGSMDEVEEERRLMYVAMTRARKELCLSFSSTPSRFLYEIPPELVEFQDLDGGRDELPSEDEMYIE
jgi:superfamily I DNA/RNA helicase